MEEFYNIKNKLHEQTNDHNTRVEKFTIDSYSKCFTSKRISSFLPKFLNSIVRNAFQLNYAQYKEFIISGIDNLQFYDKFINLL